MKKIILSLALLVSALCASAHAVWIETTLNGSKNKTQEVRVYLGEYAENVRDSVTKWFSNMKDVQLFVTAPNGDRQPITLKANGNHLVGSFTPATDGAYTLSITHAVADIYSEGKIMYYATATVVAGKPTPSLLPEATALSIVPAVEDPKKAQAVPLKVFNDKQPLAASKIEISSPDGWIKTLHSNESGEAVFSPLQSGQYLLEAVRTEKTTGEHNGKSFKTVTHIVTHCIGVK